SPVADIRSRQQLFEIFQQCKPDIVHGFDTKPAIMAPVVAKKALVPGRVRTITGMGYVFSSNSIAATALKPVYRYLQKKASDATQVTIFQNSDDRKYFQDYRMVDDDKYELVLGSGVDISNLKNRLSAQDRLVDLRRELDLDGKLVVTMVARLVVTKGVKEYLRAAKLVKQQVDRVKFILVGPISSEGRQAISLREIEKYGDSVEYLGQRNDVPALLSLSDIFVLPSFYREGVPRVLLEAGAMKLPLITTNMPGCKEVVKDGWNGLLVPPKDAESLALAIAKLLESEKLRKEMGSRAYEYVNLEFSLNSVVDAYEKIYRQILRLSTGISELSPSR
ncbi:MAG: glycosyltransferase family 4 protein, partial [Cyanobacteria bacterium P01_A01_bin.45]